MSADSGLDRLGRPLATAAAADPSGADRGAGRAKVAELARQFEAMFLVQVLRQMRESGKWDEGDEGAGSGLGFGAESLFETIDGELARHLGNAGGFGLSAQLLGAFERATGLRAGDGASLPLTEAATGHVATAAAMAGPAVAAPAAGAAARGESVGPPTGSGGARAAVEAGEAMVTPGGTVTSGYGWRRDPFTGASRFHRGIDVRAAYGDDVQAAGDGRVVFAGEQGGYGTTVVVEHAGGVRTRYAHLSASIVHEGAMVGRGQVIGQAGRSGRATGTHLHFEVTAGGRPIDPSAWGLSSRPGGRQADTDGE